MYITLNNKESDYTGSAINIDTPVIKNSDGNVITGPSITYAYYNGGSCSGTALSGAPSNAGSYSVRATANAFGEYARSDSNCATLVIHKVDSTLNASIPESITYGRTATLTYTLNPTGNVTCSSSNAHVATCSVDTTNKKITITPVNVGNTQITINGIPSNSNYNSSSVSKYVVINCSNTATEPSVVSGLIYNGSSQTGLKGGSNVNLSTTSAINAGNYTGKATPKTNYCWTDGTTTTKSYSWSIAKKDVRCSITSVPTLKYPSSATGSIKYSCTDSKVPSVTSSSTSDITVSGVTSTSATLKALKIGSSTITVSTASDTNYNASNKATSNISTSASAYTVTYNNNGGSGCTTTSVTYGGKYGTMCEPTRNGYVFIGWFDENYKDKPLNYYADTYSDLKNAFGYDADALYNHYITYGKGEGRRIWNYVDGQYGIANKTLKLYARWTPKSYTISYNSNGGTGTMASDTVSTGSKATIKSNTFTKTGYKFVGWTTKSDGTDDGYGWNPGWSGTWNYDNGQYGIANDKLVLYARWDNHYTITYNDNGGSGCSSSSKTVTYGSTYGNLCTPTRSGYIFAGWYSSNYANAPWTYYYDKYKNDSTVASIGRNDKVGLYNNYLTNSTRKFSRYTSSDTYSVNGNQTLVAGWLKFNYKREDAKYCSDGYFDTIGDAYNGCYGSTITILNDVTESSAYTFKNYASAIIGYSVTINLNSHTLTIPSLVFDSLSGEAYIFGPGKITYNSSQTNISDNSALIHVKNGILYINGGSYISNDLNSAIRAESGAKLNLSDTNSRLVIEASVINSAYTACTTGIASYDTEEFIIQAKSNGMYIYACQGIEYPGVLRVMTSYPNGNNRGVEMSVIANRGYAILKRTGNVQVGSDTCDTRDSCTAAEIAKGRLGHYGYGTEMYPYLASYSATTNDELFSVIYNNSDVVIWYTGGRLVSTKTGLSCANGGIYSSGDACYKYFSTYPIRKSNAYTGIKYSTVSNEKNSHGDNINGFKVMLYE